MAVTNFLVESLPAYVQENRDVMIKNFALVGTDTRTRISLRTGIKSKARLHDLTFGLTLQDGNGCGFNPLDTVTLSNRDIEVVNVKHDGQVCPETLLGKWAEYLVRIAATENDLPFEQYILDAMTREVNKVIEKMIWQGDTTSLDANLKWIDGFLAQFAGDASVVGVSIASGTTAYEGLIEVYSSMPEEALERGGVIFVSSAIYRSFLMDMVRLNYYHYSGPQNAAPETFILPGTDVAVIKTPGLAGSLNAVGTFAENLVYGTDVQNDEERVDLWWSQDDRVFKWQVKWASGVSYFYPSLIVLGTFAAAPAATVGVNAALAQIVENTTPGETPGE